MAKEDDLKVEPLFVWGWYKLLIHMLFDLGPCLDLRLSFSCSSVLQNPIP